jgi:hypothetical protein
MKGNVLSHDPADNDRQNGRLWRHTEKEAGAIGPRSQRVDSTSLNIGVRFNVRGREGERGAAVTQMRADLAYKPEPFSGIIFNETKSESVSVMPGWFDNAKNAEGGIRSFPKIWRLLA